jgi:hypothetical protein
MQPKERSAGVSAQLAASAKLRSASSARPKLPRQEHQIKHVVDSMIPLFCGAQTENGHYGVGGCGQVEAHNIDNH